MEGKEEACPSQKRPGEGGLGAKVSQPVRGFCFHLIFTFGAKWARLRLPCSKYPFFKGCFWKTVLGFPW